MVIEVTAEDIRLGTRKNSSCCPIALAIARVISGEILVGSSYWRRRGKLNDRHVMPIEADAFIRAFDMGDTVEPFTFVIEDGV